MVHLETSSEARGHNPVSSDAVTLGSDTELGQEVGRSW